MHLRHVHPFSAWLSVINAALLGVMLPSLMYAQGTGDFSFPMQPTQMPTQPPSFDASACQKQCDLLKQNCLSGGNPTDPASLSKCEAAVAECVARCNQAGTLPQNTLLQPGQGGFQPGQMPPSGQFPGGQPGSFQGQPGQMPSGNLQGGEGQFQGMNGPDQEQMEKMQQQQEAQMKKRQEQELQRIKRDMLNFGRNLTQIRKRVTVIEKKGTKAPTELTEALSKAEDMLGKIKAAQSFEELEDLGAGELFSDVGEVIHDQLQNLERLANVKTIYGRIDKQLKSFDKMLAQDKALTKKSKVDLSEALAEFEGNLANLKSGYAAAKQLIASGSVEEGFEALEANVFDKMDEVGENHNVIQQIGRMQTTITQAGREITSNQRQIDALKRAKKDVTAVQAIINEAKGKLAELKTLAAAKPFDPEPVFDALAEMEDLRDQFTHELNLLKGIQETDDVDQGIKMQQFSLPDLSAFGNSGRDNGGPQMNNRLPL